MRRIIQAASAAAILTTVLGSVGCAHQKDRTLEDCYRNYWDESWPDRYDYAARQSVLAPFSQQAFNGHFLEQTLWNWYFDPGTDHLTAGGIQKLDTIARMTPMPDPKIFIQTARDIPASMETPERSAAQRDDLNARRAAAVKRYMSTQPGLIPVAYEVYITDAPVPGIFSAFAAKAFVGQIAGYTGAISGGSGAAAPVPGGGPQAGGAAGPVPTGPPTTPGQAPPVSNAPSTAPGNAPGTP
jgi:hypothetical protein